MRRGYTLIEVLVTVALLAVLAGILAPMVLGAGAGGTAERLHEAEVTLKEMTDAIVAFWIDVDMWPSEMTHLVDPIGAGDTDICGVTYKGRRTRWNGPYWNKLIPAGGLPVGIGTARNAFGYVDPGAGYDIMTIIVDGVEENEAIAFNAQIDGDDDDAGGVVQWGPPSGGVVTLTWNMPITLC